MDRSAAAAQAGENMQFMSDKKMDYWVRGVVREWGSATSSKKKRACKLKLETGVWGMETGARFPPMGSGWMKSCDTSRTDDEEVKNTAYWLHHFAGYGYRVAVSGRRPTEAEPGVNAFFEVKLREGREEGDGSYEFRPSAVVQLSEYGDKGRATVVRLVHTRFPNAFVDLVYSQRELKVVEALVYWLGDETPGYGQRQGKAGKAGKAGIVAQRRSMLAGGCPELDDEGVPPAMVLVLPRSCFSLVLEEDDFRKRGSGEGSGASEVEIRKRVRVERASSEEVIVIDD